MKLCQTQTTEFQVRKSGDKHAHYTVRKQKQTLWIQLIIQLKYMAAMINNYEIHGVKRKCSASKVKVWRVVC